MLLSSRDQKTPRIGWNSQFILRLVLFGQFCWCQCTLVGTCFSTTFVCCSAPWVRSLQYLALSSVLDGNADICDQKCIGSCHNAASILWALAQIFGYIWGVVRPWNGYLGLQMESIKDRFCSIFLSPITILLYCYVTILQIMVQVTCACVVKHKSLLVSRGNATHCHQNDNVLSSHTIIDCLALRNCSNVRHGKFIVLPFTLKNWQSGQSEN